MAEKPSADVGVIGLAVMGQNLALNMADHGFQVAVFNRTTRVMHTFVAAHPDTPGGLVGCEGLTDLVVAVKTPRKSRRMEAPGADLERDCRQGGRTDGRTA